MSFFNKIKYLQKLGEKIAKSMEKYPAIARVVEQSEETGQRIHTLLAHNAVELEDEISTRELIEISFLCNAFSENLSRMISNLQHKGDFTSGRYVVYNYILKFTQGFRGGSRL